MGVTASSSADSQDLHEFLLGDGEATGVPLLVQDGGAQHVGGDHATQDDQTGLFIWSASLVLARWVATSARHDITGRSVLELGAGCGVPGLAAAVLASARCVLLTEWNHASLANLQVNAKLNKTSVPGCNIDVAKLDWSDRSTWPEPVDVILGSDLLYIPDVAGLLCAVVSALLLPNGLFLYACAEDRLGMEELPARMKAVGVLLEAEWTAPQNLIAHQSTSRPLAECCCQTHAFCEEEESCTTCLQELRSHTHIMQRYRKRPAVT